jgi:hypothetical protein
MLPTILKERFQLLLEQTKDPKLSITAREQLAAAKELLDTAHLLGYLESVEYKVYRSLCTTAGIIVSTAELKRAADAKPTNRFDGSRVEYIYSGEL